MALLNQDLPSGQKRKGKSSEIRDTIVAPLRKSKVIGGKTYYANENDEIIIKISDEEGPENERLHERPTIWKPEDRRKCCVCLKERTMMNDGKPGEKIKKCGYTQWCARYYHKECGKAVGCVYYSGGKDLECPVHYQGWVEDGIRFKYELPDEASADLNNVVAATSAGLHRVVAAANTDVNKVVAATSTDLDKVVAEVRSVFSEEEWGVECKGIVTELRKSAAVSLQLLGKYKQHVSDEQFLLLIKELVDEVYRNVASK